MPTNPFAGTDSAEPWQQGFDAGFLAPDDEHPAPSPLTLDAQDAYAQGVVAGKAAANKLSALVPQADEPPGTWDTLKEVFHIAEPVVSVGHAVYEIIAEGAAVAGTLLATGLELFVSVAIFGPDNTKPSFDEAAAQALRKAGDQLSQAGVITDNVELFMAACDRTDHTVTVQDALMTQGFWHGTVFLAFDRAQTDGKAHGHPDNTKVLRFQTVAPSLVEVIDLDAT